MQLQKKKSECPLEGKCMQINVIYQAAVETNTSSETYVGLAKSLKERYRNHKTPIFSDKHSVFCGYLLHSRSHYVTTRVSELVHATSYIT